MDKDQITSKIISIELAGCIILGVWGFAKAHYYKGLHETNRKMEKEIKKLKHELIKKDKKLAKREES